MAKKKRKKLNNFFVQRLLIVFIFLFVCISANVLVLADACVDAHQVDGKKVIHINETGFDPIDLKIKVGETVVFENEGEDSHWPASDDHPTHLKFSDLDPKKPIMPGESWEFTFTKSGTYGLHDHLFPQFIGKITVESDASLNFPCGLFNSIRGVSTTATHDDDHPHDVEPTSTITAQLLSNFKVEGNIFDIKFVQPPAFNQAAYDAASPFKCLNNDFNCVSDYLRDITKKFGPAPAISTLHAYRENTKIASFLDDHQLAHSIGRQTAITYGANVDSFLLCPTTSDMGCQHGFFELVLGKVGSSTEVASKICEGAQGKYSNASVFQCYHGIGHGLLMAKAYDVDSALTDCGKIPDQYNQMGCWQGVFMENVNGEISGYAKREGVFSDTDPLAPCNKVEDKYQDQCYLNHSGYLMRFFNNDIIKGAKACLDAGFHSPACNQSLGVLSTTPAWQVALAGNKDFDKNVEVSISLCTQFPQHHIADCYIGALDNIMNFDELRVEERAIEYCSKVIGWTQKSCYNQLGINVQRHGRNVAEQKAACAKVPAQFSADCIAGAKIQ